MIRKAKDHESEILTRISFNSKGYWNYPNEYFKVWAKELTISPGYIEQNDVYVFETNKEIIGYYSIVELENDIEISGIKIHKGFWLEHMFIVVDRIGKGIGTKMFVSVRENCDSRNIYELGILSDPNARGFYEKMGCEYIQEYPSTIMYRTTPYLKLTTKKR